MHCYLKLIYILYIKNNNFIGNYLYEYNGKKNDPENINGNFFLLGT